MSVIADIIKAPFGEIIREVGVIVDDLRTTDEERAEAHRKLVELYAKYRDQSQARAHEIEKTLLETSRDRHNFDMMSDSKFSKMIRPGAFASILAFMMLATILDSTSLTEVKPWVSFNVRDIWINLWGGALMSFIISYTGVRGWEKVTKMRTSQPTVYVPPTMQSATPPVYNRTVSEAERELKLPSKKITKAKYMKPSSIEDLE